jgi:hypothetical protein
MKSRLSYLKGKLNDLRELFWPLLEKNNENVKVNTPKIDLLIDKENLDTALQYCTKMAEAEEDRRKGIETKAALLISTSSIASTILLASSTLVTNQNQTNSWMIKGLVILSFFLVVYAIRTVWYSIKALMRQNVHVIDVTSVNLPGVREVYIRNLMINILLNTDKNRDSINAKMDNLVMAQEYYKRLICAIVLYALVILTIALCREYTSSNSGNASFNMFFFHF